MTKDLINDLREVAVTALVAVAAAEQSNLLIDSQQGLIDAYEVRIEQLENALVSLRDNALGNGEDCAYVQAKEALE